MRFAGFVPTLDVRPCPRPSISGPLKHLYLHDVYRRPTTLHPAGPTAAPQSCNRVPSPPVRAL